MTFEEMKRRKRELGYTNEDIARLSGVPLGTVQKIFAGITKAPRQETVVALRELLSEDGAWMRERRLREEAALNEALWEISRRRTAGYEAARDPEQPQTLGEAPAEYQAGTAARPLPPEEDVRQDGIRRNGPLSSVRPQAPPGGYTAEDYYALPDTPRVELIDGQIFVMEAPSATHQTILVELLRQMLPCVDEHPDCAIFAAPFDVRLDRFGEDRTMVQPDLVVTCAGHLDEKGLSGPPDLAVEISSPYSRRYDAFTKLNKYAGSGVREYWIVDPEKEQILVYILETEDPPRVYTFHDTVPVHISGGTCAVDFARIRQRLQWLRKRSEPGQ